MLVSADWLMLFADAVGDLADVTDPINEPDDDAYIAALRQINQAVAAFPANCGGSL